MSARTSAQMTAFGQFLDTLGRRKTTLTSLATGDDALAKQLGAVEPLFTAARQMAVDASQPIDTRTAAAGLLARNPDKRADTLSLLASWITPRQPGEIQRAAIRALALTADAAVPSALLDNWTSFSPETPT